MLFAPLSPQQVNNDPTSTWVAGHNGKFSEQSPADLRRFMGTDVHAKLPAHFEPINHPLTDADVAALYHTAATTGFDSRTAFPGCIGPIMDQGCCGSCWAFGGVEAMSDRLCIENVTKGFLQLSPLDVAECDQMDNGCFGGSVSGPWDYAKNNGIVTEACKPYLQGEKPNAGPIKTCAPDKEPCTNFQQTPSCARKCANGASYSGDKHTLNRVYSVGGFFGSPTQMMKELQENGPFESAFTVYADFPNYKSGVYSHKTGGELGGHAIKIIGFGTLSGTPYWLVQNSWTTTWGDKGYFKIKRGSDECGIESGPVAGSWKAKA